MLLVKEIPLGLCFSVKQNRRNTDKYQKRDQTDIQPANKNQRHCYLQKALEHIKNRQYHCLQGSAHIPRCVHEIIRKFAAVKKRHRSARNFINQQVIYIIGNLIVVFIRYLCNDRIENILQEQHRAVQYREQYYGFYERSIVTSDVSRQHIQQLAPQQHRHIGNKHKQYADYHVPRKIFRRRRIYELQCVFQARSIS